MLKALMELDWRGRRAPPTLKDGELIPGVQKPTAILCEMIASEVLRNPEKMKDNPYDPNRCGWKFDSEKPPIRLRFTLYDGRVRDIDFVEVGGERIDLYYDDERVLKSRLTAAYKLLLNIRRNEAETNRQKKAIDAIEKFMGVEPKKEEALYDDSSSLRDVETRGGSELYLSLE
jgi:hypothetical protein